MDTVPTTQGPANIAMNPIRIISLLAWAAIAAAWALPPKPAPAVPSLNAEPPAMKDSRCESCPSRAKRYAAGALPLAMGPEDLWALVNLKFKELPPLEYDHPTEDPVEIVDMESETELRGVCNYTNSGLTLVGCAAVLPGLCRIYLGPRPAWAGLTRNIVIRHETGHCNHWPADHPGAR